MKWTWFEIFFNFLSFVFIIGGFPRWTSHHIRNKVRFDFGTRELKDGFLQLLNACSYQMILAEIDTIRLSTWGKVSSNFMYIWADAIFKFKKAHEGMRHNGRASNHGASESWNARVEGRFSSTLKCLLLSNDISRDWHDPPVNVGKSLIKFHVHLSWCHIQIQESSRGDET